MYPAEVNFTAAELEIIFRIRQVIGDEKEVFIDDVNTNHCAQVTAGGSIYELQEPKGYPKKIILNGDEISTSGSVTATVINNKFIEFSSAVLVSGADLTVIYEHFKHSDLEILDTYDTSAATYLVTQCNLCATELGIDLLILATAYILLLKDLNVYIKSAVNLEDSDSRFDASRRPQYLSTLLDKIGAHLKDAIEAKTKCSMMSLPLYKVE